MVKKVFSFVYKEVRGLHQAAYVLALFAFLSQLLAIVRDRLLAHSFGASGELDVYYAAFRIPDTLFVLFASALSVFVLLPFVTKRSESDGPKAGVAVLSQMFGLFLVLYIALAAGLALAAPWYIPALFPGLAESHDVLVMMVRILLLQPLLLGISSLCGVVTQMHHRFVLYAISPLLYNIGIIVGLLFLYPMFGLLGLALGVLLGALCHLLVQVPYIMQSQFSFLPTIKFDRQLITQIVRIAVPRALTLSVSQVVLLVFVGLATVMTVGSVSVFQFALNLQSVPLAIIGVSYSVAAFPTLSSLFAQNNLKGFNDQLVTAFRHIIFWSMPIIALVVVLRAQIVRVILGSGEFDWSDTRLTAAILAIFVLSLTAQAILLLLIRAFYACGRTMTPLWIAVVSGSVSVSLAFLFRGLYHASAELQATLDQALRITDVAGSEVLVLALAFACGQLLQLTLLLIASKQAFGVVYNGLYRLLAQALASSLVGGLAAYITLQFVVERIDQDTFVGILLQGVIAGVVGLGVIGIMYYWFGSQELREIIRSFKTKIRPQSKQDSAAQN